jgi:hypothetical protein
MKLIKSTKKLGEMAKADAQDIVNSRLKPSIKACIIEMASHGASVFKVQNKKHEAFCVKDHGDTYLFE